jgi:hypothetical protein
MTAPPPYPIIVGVTGHRDIAPGAEHVARASVQALLASLHTKFGDALHVMTALADGADQLVADAAENLADKNGHKTPLKIIAVSPMSLGTYEKTVADKTKLAHHWDRAVLKMELPDVTAPPTPDYDELQYEQLGALLARCSHLLLALWDGQQAAARRGGTTAVVRFRQQNEHLVTGFRESKLFTRAFTRLDLSRGGPILQIVAPRIKNGGAVVVHGQTSPKAGECFLLPESDDPSAPRPAPVHVSPDTFFTALADQERRDFDQIIQLNKQITQFGKTDEVVLETQLGYLRVTGIDDPPGEPGAHLNQLRVWQAAADSCAQHFQRRLLGQFAPAQSGLKILPSSMAALCHLRRPPHIGIVFGFAAAVPAAVLMFETYAHLGRSPWALAIYLAVFGGTAAFYHFHVRHHKLQDYFQDYRAMAEAMRVQLFWAAAAVPVAVSDNYLRKQSGELGWIQFALRGPSLWALALALRIATPQRDLVTKGWIVDQKKFFTKKSVLHEHASIRSRLWSKRFLYGGLVLSLVLAAIEVSKLVLGAQLGPMQMSPQEIEHLQDWLLVLAATAPAMAAFFAVSMHQRAYEAHAHSYALMERIFTRAEQLAGGLSDDQFRELVRELGRDALCENAEWLLDHRGRPIEHQ